jgi:RNA recognition motif-containing protein
MHYTVSENDVRALFSPFGIITKIDMSFDVATSRSKGYCFLEYSDPNSATAAMEMNQFELGGRKVSFSLD